MLNLKTNHNLSNISYSPRNQDVAVLHDMVPAIPLSAFTIPMLLHENRLRNLVVQSLNPRVDILQQVTAAAIKNVIVWGLPTHPIADLFHAKISGFGGLVGTGQLTRLDATLRDEVFMDTGVQVRREVVMRGMERLNAPMEKVR